MDLTRVRIALVLASLSVAACSGARHRKPVGPPPEYELPEEPDAGPAAVPARDGGAPVRDGGAR
jgi:hypothetical protein